MLQQCLRLYYSNRTIHSEWPASGLIPQNIRLKPKPWRLITTTKFDMEAKTVCVLISNFTCYKKYHYLVFYAKLTFGMLLLWNFIANLICSCPSLFQSTILVVFVIYLTYTLPCIIAEVFKEMSHGREDSTAVFNLDQVSLRRE